MKNKKNQITVLIMTLLMMLMMTSAVFADSWTYQDRISVQTGEPVYIAWSSSPQTSGTLTAVNSSYYPSTFVLWVGDGSDPVVSAGTATFLYQTQTTLEDNTVVTNKAYQITLTGAGNIKVTLDNTEYTITNSAPSGTAPSAALPSAFNKYLPLGQFATGSGWGSIHTNGTNSTGSTKKFLSGYCSTGISLGAVGGFTDYNFNATNASSHPYGVDFIVYGNAFNGNPEAGAVKVYGFTSPEDTTGEWYHLSHSMYYDGSVTTKNSQDVYWKLVVSNDDDAKGIWYQFVDTGDTPSSTGWIRFTKNYNWWPFANSSGTISDAKGYGAINGFTADTAFSNDAVEVNADRTQIVFKDIDLVKDTDTTNDYQFGFFDVHPNGSTYGTAVNPYTITGTSQTQSGDGYDLSWAIDSNGKPVALDRITKVRLYTCAAMNSDGTAFTVPSIFGETSAEVDGVYGVNGTGTLDVWAVKVSDGSKDYYPDDLGCETINMTSGSISLTFTCGADRLFVNGQAIDSGSQVTFNVGSGSSKYIQIISQAGDSSPLVTTVKLVRS